MHWHADDVYSGYLPPFPPRAYPTREEAREAARKIAQYYAAQGLTVTPEGPDCYWIGSLTGAADGRPAPLPVRVVPCDRTDIVGLDF